MAVFNWALSQEYRCKPLSRLVSLGDTRCSHLGLLGNRKGYPDIFLPYPVVFSKVSGLASQSNGVTSVNKLSTASSELSTVAQSLSTSPPVPAVFPAFPKKDEQPPERRSTEGREPKRERSDRPEGGFESTTTRKIFLCGYQKTEFEAETETETEAAPRLASESAPRLARGDPKPESSGYAGLFIELKRYKPKGYLSSEQKEWLAYLTEVGYYATMCRGSYAAILTLQWYLSSFGLGEGYMEFEIDHGVAVPDSLVTRSPRCKYPFDKMKVGDSFHVAAGPLTGATDKIRTRLYQAVSTAHRQLREAGETDLKMVVGIVGGDDPRGEGVRVHRVS